MIIDNRKCAVVYFMIIEGLAIESLNMVAHPRSQLVLKLSFIVLAMAVHRRPLCQVCFQQMLDIF